MKLEKFEILEEIGHGGFGTVYLANDTTLERIVALKILHQQYLSDQKFIESFKREARMMARVSHPNVVQIFEVGDLEGQIYIAMQYFDGGNLDQKIQAGGPLPLRDAIRMLSQTARGLEAGHKIGLVHRDVKPANILYNRDGYIAISDFGVAKSIQQSSAETTNTFNQFAGTPYYIPPEFWKSEGNASPAADVYSLACVFYEALTGEILFAGDTYEHVLTRHVLEAPQFSNSFPESLADTLSVALAKNPSDRYQTMNDFLAAIRGALEKYSHKSKQGKNSVVEELPKPKGPWEITFDELVQRSQQKSTTQSTSALPATTSQPVSPLFRPNIPTPQSELQKVEPEPQEKAEVPTVLPIIPPSQKKERSITSITEDSTQVEPTVAQSETSQLEILAEISETSKRGDLSNNERVEIFPSPSSDKPPMQNVTVKRPQALKEANDWNVYVTQQPSKTYPTIPPQHGSTPTQQPPIMQTGYPPPQAKRGPLEYEQNKTKPTKSLIELGFTLRQFLILVVILTIGLLSNIRRSGLLTALNAPQPTEVSTSFLVDEQPTPEPTKTPEIPQQAPTLVPTNTQVALVTETQIPQEIPVPERPVVQIDWPVSKIVPLNASQVSQLNSYGDGMVSRLAWDPWGSELAVVTNNKILIFGGTDFELRREFAFEEGSSRIAWSPDGQWIASDDRNMNLVIWNAQTGTEFKRLAGHEGGIKAIAWSPDGEYLASASTDNTIRIWDGNNFNYLRSLRGHADWVRDISWSPDGTMLASASDDKLVKIWDPQTGKLIRNLSGHTEYVTALSWSPDGNSLVSGGYDESIRLWDPLTGNTKNILKEEYLRVDRLFWTPDNSKIVFFKDYGVISFWDGISNNSSASMEGEYGFGSDLAYGPDGQTVAVIGSNNVLSVWDPSRSKFEMNFAFYPNRILAVAWSPDGDIYAAGGFNNEVMLFNQDSTARFRVLTGHSDWIRTLAFSPDGTVLASGSDDGDVILWDTAKWNLIKRLSGGDLFLFTLAWSNDGDTIVTGNSSGSIQIWNAKTGTLLSTLSGHSDWVNSVVWSPNDLYFASAAGDNTIIIWDASSLEKITTLTKHTEWVSALAWSPDGSTLASASSDGYLYLWDTSNWTVRSTLLEASYYVGTMEWSPSGGVLALADGGGFLELWDPENGDVFIYLNNHTENITDISWSPNGAMLLTGSNDGTIRLWGIER